MIATFLVVFLFMISIVAVMAVGVIFGRKPIAGSCGGMSAIGMESECDVCGGDKTKCDKESKTDSKTDLGYDATSD
jgi:hypothetical protein